MNPSRDKGAESPAIFNLNVVYAQGVQEVFVTEGAFDALSIIEAGAAAIALNSTSNAEALVKRLEQRRTAATLILCLDNDDAGKKAADTLKQGLQRLNISHITADICNGSKDPNEALTTDRGAFIEAIERAQHMTAARPDNTSYFIDHLMSGEIEHFREVKKTGFTNLDEQAGGLYSGLYTVAAISSLGKTTFCHQIADQLAAAGTDVLFFSLEQSRLELVSKSIARRTAQNDLDTAVTSLSIRRGYLPRQVLQAAEQYKQEVQERISIIEGNFACNISFIGDYIRQYIRRNDTRPVIFIDYLQILQPEQNGNRQQTTKEMVDTTITALKRISRELDLTVFVVCSVNRANYLTPIDFESLKESGGIEYTSDCIWGLQLQCLNDPLFDKANNIKERREKIKEAKAATPRKIELVCLKNRYGVANFSCYFNYYPANDLFTPCSDAELDFTPAEAPKKAGKKL
jgi:replicative DNA helicase